MKRVLLTEREYRALTKIRHGVSHFNNHLIKIKKELN